MSKHILDKLLHPRSIAVVGASARTGRGPAFFNAIHEFGFKGELYPVNPKYDEVFGIKAYPSVKDIPGEVDYVISSVPASQVLGLISDCADKGVKIIHLFTARFSETGRKDAADLEQEILRQAKKAGIRLIGPNCMGVYFPEAGLSFRDHLPKESGSIGVISQSGSAIGNIIEGAGQNNLHFSTAISYGNALDFNECDYLEYLEQDPNTSIILMYIEGVRDGKRFFSILRRTTATKPVIILKGGRGESGTRATASHTASLAGSMAVWHMAVKQAGAVSARHFEELTDAAAAFHYLKPTYGHRVGIAGGAGGSSVLAADLCEEADLNVIPFPQEIREELKARGSQIWDWISNPVDMSIRVDRNEGPGEIMKLMAKNPNFDLLIAFIHAHSHGGSQDHSVKSILKEYCLDEINKPLLAIIEEQTDSENIVGAFIAELNRNNVPVYPQIERAAIAARKVIDYYQHKKSQ